jgi:hypothetical protein
MANVIPVNVTGSALTQKQGLSLPAEELASVQNALVPCPAWHAAEKERLLCRDCMEGITALRTKGRDYLPQKELETDTAYDKRLKTATFYNQFSRAIDSLVGRVFSRTTTLVEPDDAWSAWQDDVDLEGNNLHVFCEELFSDAIAEGLSYIMIDMPSLPIAQTQEEEKSQALVRRPYWVHLKAYEVIGWVFERVGGINVLTKLRTLQRKQVEAQPHVYEERQILRIYTPGHCLQYEVTMSGEVMDRKEYKMSMPMIPIVAVYTKRRRPFDGAPPLHDMATLCLRHYQSSSAQNHILDYSRFPLLFGRQLFLEGQDSLASGVSGMIHSHEEKADLKYVEHNGAAINAGAESLKDLEKQIAMLSYEPLLRQTTGTESATRATLDTATASSALQAWARALADALEQALVLTAMWKAPGLLTAPDVSVNTTHGLSASVEELTPLLELRKSSQLSRSTLWKELYRRGVLGPGFDPKEEARLLLEEGGMNEHGEGLLKTLVEAKTLPKRYLFESAKKAGYIAEDVQWEAVLEELSRENESGNNSNPLGAFDAMFQNQG